MNNVIDTNLSSRSAACSLPGSMLSCFVVAGPKTGFAYLLTHLLMFLGQMAHVFRQGRSSVCHLHLSLLVCVMMMMGGVLH